MLHGRHFENDLKYCKKCFQTQMSSCLDLFESIEPSEDHSLRQLLALMPENWCKRQNQLIKLRNSKQQLIAKYYPQTGINLKKSELKKQLLRKMENLQGVQYVPVKTLDQFIDNLHLHHTKLPPVTIWLYVLVNVQLVIMQLLYERNFPVPFIQTVCGFTMFQSYSGEDLNHFFKADFKIKSLIAQQLLEAAVKFSYGFDNYRLYITDLTADNVVYDKHRNKLTFIDLDTIFIVDSTQAIYNSSVHKYEYIECNGCFAYSTEDIASYNISDVNIFSACQFLREDLYKDITKGFLYPLPSAIVNSYSNLKLLIDQCVDCPSNLCQQRFTVAQQLIAVFQQINHDYKEIKKQ
ncbi:hypothetical protein DOY81_006840 [Sarcophaga bullata]|nr:hypothetical protein DOY81_006840 [Sarcophaga bullata]